MDFYSIIESVTRQFVGIMDGLKPMVAFGGFVMFALSGKALLNTSENEKKERAIAWSGLFFSTFPSSIERWMGIATASIYGSDLGPIYRVGVGYENTRDALAIFNAVEVYVIAFGWFGFIAAIIKLADAPKYNSPGMKRRALIAMGIAVAMANPKTTIDIVGFSVGKSNAYNSMRDVLTR